MVTSSEVKGLKVAELKAELSSRGLPTDGNKLLLQQRLEQALAAEEPTVDTAVPDIAPEPALEPTPPSAVAVTSAAVAPELAVADGTANNAAAAEKPVKIITLDRSHKVIMPQQQPAATTAQSIEQVAQLSAEERKRLRAERFKSNSDDYKLKQRAARFGLPYAALEEEKKEARKARFGIVSEDEKLAKRKARFGVLSNDEKKEIESREEADKISKRIQRFGFVKGASDANKPIATSKQDSDAKLKSRAERFGLQPTTQKDKRGLEPSNAPKSLKKART